MFFLKKIKLNWLHLSALTTIALYLLFSKAVLVHSALSGNLAFSFFGPLVYGCLAGLVFLYLFSHEKFFPLARQIEKEEVKKEKKYLKRFSHYGRLIACFLIGVIGGPLFGALTVRLLIHRQSFWFKYAVVFISTILSTFFLVGLTSGILSIF